MVSYGVEIQVLKCLFTMKNRYQYFLGLGLVVSFHKSNFLVPSKTIGLVPPGEEAIVIRFSGACTNLKVTVFN